MSRTVKQMAEGMVYAHEQTNALLGSIGRDSMFNDMATVAKAMLKGQEFKDYVHKRLDDAGIPVDPDSPHKAEGCRIGGRLDVLIGQRDELLAACRRARECWTIGVPGVPEQLDAAIAKATTGGA